MQARALIVPGRLFFDDMADFSHAHKAHPWHGIDLGPNCPDELRVFIEIVPTDTVKYEVDKASGYLSLDRPQKFSNIVPSLYGFIPRTYCDKKMASKTNDALARYDIEGDHDPLDILVLGQEPVFPLTIMAARPIGVMKMIDQGEADDKIIAVLRHDATYSGYNDISELPKTIVNRLKHYFLTYKDMPDTDNSKPKRVEIIDTYGKEEAHEIIRRSLEDYKCHFDGLEEILRHV